jgi:Tat protein translocase TatB subunit
MFNIGPAELIVILLVALLIVGPKRLPEVGKSVGKALREIRRQTDEVRSSFELNLDDDDDEYEPVEDVTGRASTDDDDAAAGWDATSWDIEGDHAAPALPDSGADTSTTGSIDAGAASPPAESEAAPADAGATTTRRRRKPYAAAAGSGSTEAGAGPPTEGGSGADADADADADKS